MRSRLLFVSSVAAFLGTAMVSTGQQSADRLTAEVFEGLALRSIGPSLTTWQPLQATFELYPHHIFSFEYFAYTPIAEWDGRKLRIPIEDDAILMESGIQFLHPANYRLLVIK